MGTVTCPDCNGSGLGETSWPRGTKKTCPTCHGAGIDGDGGGPENDDWINRAYQDQAGPNPHAKGIFHDRRSS